MERHVSLSASYSKDPAELASQLEDTLASLQTALARINAYRVEVKQLSKELVDAKSALDAAGIDPASLGRTSEVGDDGTKDDDASGRAAPLPPKAPTAARDALRKISTSMKRSSSTNSMHRVSSSTSLRGQLPTQQPLFFYHGERKVKGFVFGREGCLEFYELVASITPPQFVGVAHVDDPNLKTVGDHHDLPPDQGQQWFDLGWLFHPQDVISNLSHYLTDTLVGDSPSSVDDGEGTAATQWGDVEDVASPPEPSTTTNEEIRATLEHAKQKAAAGGEGRGEGETGTQHMRTRTSTADGNDSLDLTRWDLPVGRKGGPSETWELVWKQQEGPGKLQRLVFEGSTAACTMITKQIEGWHTLAPEQVQPAARSMPGSTRMGGPVGAPTGEDASEGDAQEQGGNEGGGEKGDDEEKGGSGEKEEGDGMDAPLHLVPGPTMPQLSEPSQLLTDVQIRALVTALPTRYRLSNTWTLVYSTQRHGISLQTLYRRAQTVAPTILVVRDTGGYVFGAYCSEPWHVAARYFGTGETFVFQLQPHMVAWHWHRRTDDIINSFFMYACHDNIAVGGGTDFALWLDADMNHGHSGACDTFGSPCLASDDDFVVGHVEIWAPH